MTTRSDQQRRLTRDALTALAGTDFALAGAGAIREHGITDRPTHDVDLFTASVDAARFAEAVDRLSASLTAAGYTMQVLRRAATFARLLVSTADGTALEVDLAADWRSTDAVPLAVGPVLALTDAVGSKLGALYSRTETRDFLDVDAIRRSGRFTAPEVEGYRVDADQLTAVQQRLTAWAQTLRS